MYDWDLQVAPSPPGAELEQRVLAEWLRNPFLDEDLGALSLRVDAPVPEVQGALKGLSDTGFLRGTAGGYTLALDFGGGTVADAVTVAAPPPARGAPAADAEVQLASLSGAIAVDPTPEEDESDEAHGLLWLVEERGDPLARQIEETLCALLPQAEISDGDLLEALPFGLVVLQSTGARELANDRAAFLLGLPRDQVDGATFELITGVNPLAALEQADPLTFSLTEPRALEITLQGRRLATGSVVLILLRDVSLLEEVSQIQAELQEELYERLREEMVHPLAMIEGFLERPDAEGLARARIAMEQINWFLQEFLLRGRDTGQA